MNHTLLDEYISQCKMKGLKPDTKAFHQAEKDVSMTVQATLGTNKQYLITKEIDGTFIYTAYSDGETVRTSIIEESV